MKFFPIVCSLLVSLSTAFSLTLDELKAAPNLTPQSFARFFADFKFELRDDVQPTSVFLGSKSGDCDDYAVLAADVLRELGFTTKLVVVFMAKSIHVVCYVNETKSYLDFNRRAAENPTTASDGSLEDIAIKVSQSFNASWHCVSEFTYKDGTRKFVYTDFPQAKPPSSTASVAQNAVQKSAAVSATAERPTSSTPSLTP
jgi:hypothetical protein